MSLKSLSFKFGPKQGFDFTDRAKWESEDGKSYKLLNPDFKKDKLYASAEITTAVKAERADEKLWVMGVANANIVDRMQERLDPRGLDITDYVKNRQLLAHHSYYHPIGQVEELDVREDGVHFRAWIGDPARAELTEMQKEIRSLVAQGILKTVSVGFIPRKVRAPLFNNDGTIAEPCVIESWELLELSVVAVPCNQDSVFQVRDAESLVDSKLKASQTIQNSKEAGGEMLRKAKTTPTEKTVEETESAGAVSDQTKTDAISEEMLSLLRTMAEAMKRQAEMSDLILSKLEASAGGESTDEGGGDAPQQDAAKTAEPTTEQTEPESTDTSEPSGEVNTEAQNTRLDAIEETIKGFNAQFDKLGRAVKLLADHITKK
jgi:HK97 family phage prohead protease